MKVDNERRKPAAEPRTDFKQTLKTTTTKPVVKPQLKSVPKLAAGASSPVALGRPLAFAEARANAHRIADGLQKARVGMDVTAFAAQGVRTESVSGNERMVEGKALELIANELKSEMKQERSEQLLGGDPKPAQVVHFARAGGAVGVANKAESETKAAGIMELVERIRVFEKAGRPAMALTVGGSLNAEVEIERAGPKLVSLKIVGKLKSPSVSGLNEIREELLKRGIKVAALSINSR